MTINAILEIKCSTIWY